MPGVDELSKAIHSLGCGKTPVCVIDGISSTMILHEEWETSTFAGSILTNALSLLGKTIMFHKICAMPQSSHYTRARKIVETVTTIEAFPSSASWESIRLCCPGLFALFCLTCLPRVIVRAQI